MTLVRRHLRLLATAWILLQAMSLSALVPRACCLAHEAAMASGEQPMPPDCPMPSRDENRHSMHHMHGGSHHDPAQNDQKPARDCAIRGLCGGPLSALFAIFSTQGVLTDSFTTLPDVRSTNAALTAADQPIGLFTPPDAPPPRS